LKTNFKRKYYFDQKLLYRIGNVFLNPYKGRSDSSNMNLLIFPPLFWGLILACPDPDPLAQQNPEPKTETLGCNDHLYSVVRRAGPGTSTGLSAALVAGGGWWGCATPTGPAGGRGGAAAAAQAPPAPPPRSPPPRSPASQAQPPVFPEIIDEWEIFRFVFLLFIFWPSFLGILRIVSQSEHWFQSGLAIKNPPKKTKKPTKNVFFWVFLNLKFCLKIMQTFLFETDF
jgi:hypothetical protein